MTVEQQSSLQRELEGAMASGDAQRIRCAHSNILLALMDCQQKTAKRVKSLGWRFTLAVVTTASSGGFIAGKWELIKVIFFGG